MTESDESSSPWEFRPQALPDPDVNFSAHPAPIDQLKVEHQVANAQTYLVFCVRYALTSDMLFADERATFCISASPILSRHN